MSVFLFDSVAEEVFGVLIVIFRADAITGYGLCVSSLKVLFVPIQQILPRRCFVSCYGQHEFAHKNFQSIRGLLLIAFDSRLPRRSAVTPHGRSLGYYEPSTVSVGMGAAALKLTD